MDIEDLMNLVKFFITTARKVTKQQIGCFVRPFVRTIKILLFLANWKIDFSWCLNYKTEPTVVVNNIEWSCRPWFGSEDSPRFGYYEEQCSNWPPFKFHFIFDSFFVKVFITNRFRIFPSVFDLLAI